MISSDVDDRRVFKIDYRFIGMRITYRNASIGMRII